jgi:hypothetical protein
MLENIVLKRLPLLLFAAMIHNSGDLSQFVRYLQVGNLQLSLFARIHR